MVSSFVVGELTNTIVFRLCPLEPRLYLIMLVILPTYLGGEKAEQEKHRSLKNERYFPF